MLTRALTKHEFLFQKINYKSLNSKRKEAYNYQKVSGVLAEYGFLTIRLSDDWEGADFLALHISGETLKIQLKGRLYFSKKYFGKIYGFVFMIRGIGFYVPTMKPLS